MHASRPFVWSVCPSVQAEGVKGFVHTGSFLSSCPHSLLLTLLLEFASLEKAGVEGWIRGIEGGVDLSHSPPTHRSSTQIYPGTS